MSNYKSLISGKNVDAIYINDKYQNELQALNLNSGKIQHHQFVVDIVTTEKQKIKVFFHSLQDLLDFSNAYELK